VTVNQRERSKQKADGFVLVLENRLSRGLIDRCVLERRQIVVAGPVFHGRGRRYYFRIFTRERVRLRAYRQIADAMVVLRETKLNAFNEYIF